MNVICNRRNECRNPCPHAREHELMVLHGGETDCATLPTQCRKRDSKYRVEALCVPVKPLKEGGK